MTEERERKNDCEFLEDDEVCYSEPLLTLKRTQLISRVKALGKENEDLKKERDNLKKDLKATEADKALREKEASEISDKLKKADAENKELYKKVSELEKKVAEGPKTPAPKADDKSAAGAASSGPEIDRSILSKSGKEEYDALIDTLVTAGEKKEKLSKESERRLKAKRAISSL